MDEKSLKISKITEFWTNVGVWFSLHSYAFTTSLFDHLRGWKVSNGENHSQEKIPNFISEITFADPWAERLELIKEAVYTEASPIGLI